MSHNFIQRIWLTNQRNWKSEAFSCFVDDFNVLVEKHMKTNRRIYEGMYICIRRIPYGDQ